MRQGGMIKTPINLQELRKKIYAKAKADSQWKFWGLYVHICKLETLKMAYKQAKSNKGVAGIDGITFKMIEAEDADNYLQAIQKDLINGNYKPSKAKQVEIPKADGKGTRKLNIPTIRDRIVEGAVKLMIEPIFESDSQDGSYGYRPQRKASEAVEKVAKAILSGKSKVIDLDMKSYFDTVRHDILLRKIATRIQDNQVLHLIKVLLKASGKRGLKQGGVLSPVLSNLYLNDVDKMREKAKEVTKTNGYSNVDYVRWADDLIVLVDGHSRHSQLQKAVEKRLKEELSKLDLTINEEKSNIIDLSKPKSYVEFLGFQFRKMVTRKGKQGVLRLPKTTARIKLQRKLKTIFKAKRSRPTEEVINEINPILRGWVNYFRIGNAGHCFQKLEQWVQRKLRRHIMKASKRQGYGWKRWTQKELYRNTGIYHDYHVKYTSD